MERDNTLSMEQTFQHEAMNTTFTLRLICKDSSLMKSALTAAIELIDTLEETLSRYIPGSDIWQINHMEAGESLFIDDHTDECLRAALEIHSRSGGLFDISLGRQIEHLKSQTDGPAPAAEGSLQIDPDKPAIHCIEPGREIDLGGIGKGYALDCVREKLPAFGIHTGLLSAGASTHLAFGDRSWPISLVGASGQETIELENMALSVSGADVQGEHIFSPTEGPTSDASKPKMWVLHKSAAHADAWSTACYLMDNEELEQLTGDLTVIRGTS